MVPTIMSAQDYQMFEVHYLRPIVGNETEVSALIAGHNKSFHNKGPYNNAVFSVLSGPRSGAPVFTMMQCASN